MSTGTATRLDECQPRTPAPAAGDRNPVVVKTRVEESLGANPADAALNPADSVAMGVPTSRVPRFLLHRRAAPFRALVHREFALLFLAFLINQVGFWVSHISLQRLMVDLSDNDPAIVGLLFFALFIPAFALAPVAGVVADRFDRRSIVLLCYAALTGIAAALAWLTISGAIAVWSMLALAFLMGCCFSFSGPANAAITANSVPEADLPSAVALQSAANNLTRVGGPMLAAPLIAGGFLGLAFALFATTAAASGTLVSRIRLSPHVVERDELGIVGRMRNGLQHARERRPALPALLTVAALSLFGVSHMALLPVYAETVLGDITTFSYIVAAQGLGAMTAAILTGYRDTTTLRAAGAQVAAYGAFLALFALTTHPLLAIAAQSVIGFFYFSVMTSLQTLIQQVVDDSRRGRVMSLFQVAWAGLIPFGGLAMGAFAAGHGVVETLLIAAAVCAGYGLALVVYDPR